LQCFIVGAYWSIRIKEFAFPDLDTTKVAVVTQLNVSFKQGKLQASFHYFYINLMCKKIKIKLILFSLMVVFNFFCANQFGTIKKDRARFAGFSLENLTTANHTPTTEHFKRSAFVGRLTKLPHQTSAARTKY
jgi:hypothetical protein